MRQLLYISSAAASLAPDIAAILATSIRNNRRDGVTGLLWTDGKRFLQVLEGEHDAVGSVFARISADPRHRGVVVLHDRVIERPEFGEWSMACRGADDSPDRFDASMAARLSGISPAVRGTFEGLIAARRAA